MGSHLFSPRPRLPPFRIESRPLLPYLPPSSLRAFLKTVAKGGRRAIQPGIETALAPPDVHPEAIKKFIKIRDPSGPPVVTSRTAAGSLENKSSQQLNTTPNTPVNTPTTYGIDPGIQQHVNTFTCNSERISTTRIKARATLEPTDKNGQKLHPTTAHPLS